MTPTNVLRVLAAATLSGTLLLMPSTASADQVRDGQWVNQAFDLQKVWSVSQGDGIIVAVIDNGVDASQPDLAGQVLPGYDPDGQGRDRQPGTESHGTQMASLIAAHGHGPGNADGVVGLAPHAKILPLYKEKGGADAVPEDIRWAVDKGAKVINISLGGVGHTDTALSEAVAYAASHDVLIVASSGNSDASVESPANEPGVLAVGAVQKNLTVWDKSNYGPEVLLTAPGVDVVAAGIGQKYQIDVGTSDATAYVSGAAALVRSKFPNLTAGQVADRLVKSALVPDQLKGAKLPDPHYGYGIVRPYQALTQEIASGPAQGPLALPKMTGSQTGGATVPGSASASSARPSHKFPVLAAVLGGGLILVVLVVIVIVLASRRRPPSGPAVSGMSPNGSGPGWHQPGQPPYGTQTPPPGFPPQQPYQNQPWQQGGDHQR